MSDILLYTGRSDVDGLKQSLAENVGVIKLNVSLFFFIFFF